MLRQAQHEVNKGVGTLILSLSKEEDRSFLPLSHNRHREGQ